MSIIFLVYISVFLYNDIKIKNAGDFMKKEQIIKITMAAMFMAIGLVLPFITGQIPAVANMLLPMHLPVLLCGLICGPIYGGIVGAILPLLRCLLFQMPKVATAIPMSYELFTYGLVIGIVYSIMRKKVNKNIVAVYISLIIAMLLGRAVWALPKYLVMTYMLGNNDFTFKFFIMEAFVNSVLGIVIQLILIPAIMEILLKTHLIPIDKTKRAGEQS